MHAAPCMDTYTNNMELKKNGIPVTFGKIKSMSGTQLILGTVATPGPSYTIGQVVIEHVLGIYASK